jgi:hypothetical protein
MKKLPSSCARNREAARPTVRGPERVRVERIESAGIKVRAVPLMMTDHDATADMVSEVIALAGL